MQWGIQAGYNLTTGNNNIDIGNVGVAGESNLIRIGTKGTQKGAVIAGISTSTVTGSAVYVTTTGRLGVLASSERYKTAIAPIGDSTDKLGQLRPVSFHLKADPEGRGSIRTDRRGSGEGVSGAGDPQRVGPDRRRAL